MAAFIGTGLSVQTAGFGEKLSKDWSKGGHNVLGQFMGVAGWNRCPLALLRLVSSPSRVSPARLSS